MILTISLLRYLPFLPDEQNPPDLWIFVAQSKPTPNQTNAIGDGATVINALHKTDTVDEF